MIYAKKRKLEGLERTKEKKKKVKLSSENASDSLGYFYVFIIKPMSATQEVT